MNNQKTFQFGVSSLLGGAYFRVVLIFEGAYFRRNTVHIVHTTTLHDLRDIMMLINDPYDSL